jgi:hypothetical protein
MYYSDIFMAGLRKTTKAFSYNVRDISRDLKPRQPKYEARVVLGGPRSAVLYDGASWLSLRADLFCVI